MDGWKAGKEAPPNGVLDWNPFYEDIAASSCNTPAAMTCTPSDIYLKDDDIRFIIECASDEAEKRAYEGMWEAVQGMERSGLSMKMSNVMTLLMGDRDRYGFVIRWDDGSVPITSPPTEGTERVIIVLATQRVLDNLFRIGARTNLSSRSVSVGLSQFVNIPLAHEKVASCTWTHPTEGTLLVVDQNKARTFTMRGTQKINNTDGMRVFRHKVLPSKASGRPRKNDRKKEASP